MPLPTPGPLRTILDAVGTRIQAFKTDALMLQDQMSVQNATDDYLDRHGVLYGVTRITQPTVESNENYRARILAAMTNSKLTIPNIRAAVTAYYAAHNVPATVDVLDLQSNPTVAQANGLVAGQFLITVTYAAPRIRAFFLGRAHLGRESYLLRFNVFTSGANDPVLTSLVNGLKAAGYQPLYLFTIT